MKYSKDNNFVLVSVKQAYGTENALFHYGTQLVKVTKSHIEIFAYDSASSFRAINQWFSEMGLDARLFKKAGVAYIERWYKRSEPLLKANRNNRFKLKLDDIEYK